MKIQLVALAISLGVSRVFAQDVFNFDFDTLPRCTVQCITQVTGNSTCVMEDPACVCAQPLLQACMIDQCPPEFTSSLEPYCNYASQTGSPSATVSASSSLPFTIQTETSAGNNSPSPTITPSTTRSISTIPSASLSSAVVTALTSAVSVASTAAATTGAGNNGAGARVGMMDIEIGLGLIGMALVGGWMAI